MPNVWFLSVFLSCVNVLFGQVTVEVEHDGEPIALNQWGTLPNGDSVYLNEFKFYLVLPTDSLVLVDLSDPESCRLPLFSLDDETVLLQIGMDSALNVCGRFDGPYDPLLGMYWAWNTGYMQLKCKGIMSRSGIQFPFEYHLGGYRSPHATCVKQWVRLDRQTCRINLDVFLSHLPVMDQPHLMQPGATAQQLFKRFTEGFE